MPVIGATSTKIALHAGMLLIAARIGVHPVHAILEPSVPVSIAGPALADRLGLSPGAGAQPLHGHTVLGIDHVEIPLHTLRIGDVAGADMIAGRDVMHEPILLDFVRDRLRVSTGDVERRMERTMTSVPIAEAADGCLSVAATTDDGTATTVALVGDGSATPVPDAREVRIGDIAVHPAPAGRCTQEAGSIGWQAFAGRRIVIDVPAGRMWISAGQTG